MTRAAYGSTMPRIEANRLLPLLFAGALACAGGNDDAAAKRALAPPAWNGTERDSAGVDIVENPDAGVWERGGGWRLERTLDVGGVDGSPDYEFGEIRGVAVDDPGAMYVLDAQARRVAVYDSLGAFVRTFGGPGAGPGELSDNTGGLLLLDGALLIPDPGNRRVDVFTTAGDFVRSRTMRMDDGIPVDWAAGGGAAIAQLRSFEGDGRPDLLVAYRDGGSAVDTVLTLPRGASLEYTDAGPTATLFAAEPVWTPTADGGLASATSDRYRITIRDADGAVSRVVTLAREPASMTDASKSRLRERMRAIASGRGAPAGIADRILDESRIADHFPLFAALLAGPDGTLWLQRVHASADGIDAYLRAVLARALPRARDLGSGEWDVIDADGRYLGVVEAPPRFRGIRFVGDDLYGVWRDDLDIQHVLRLRLVRDGDRAASTPD